MKVNKNNAGKNMKVDKLVIKRGVQMSAEDFAKCSIERYEKETKKEAHLNSKDLRVN